MVGERLPSTSSSSRDPSTPRHHHCHHHHHSGLKKVLMRLCELTKAPESHPKLQGAFVSSVWVPGTYQPHWILEQIPGVTGWLSGITVWLTEVLDWLHGMIGRLTWWTYDRLHEILDQLWDHCNVLVDLGQRKWLCFSQTKDEDTHFWGPVKETSA